MFGNFILKAVSVLCLGAGVCAAALAARAEELRPGSVSSVDAANPRRAAVMGANFDPVTSDGIDSRGGRSSVMILEEEPEVRK